MQGRARRQPSDNRRTRRRHVGRVDEADGGVEAGWPEFLEVARFVDAGEGVLRRRAFQRLGLPPDLAGSFARGARVGNHIVTGRRDVLDQGMTGERVVRRHPAWGQRLGHVRAGIDRADDAVTVALGIGHRVERVLDGAGVLVVRATRRAEQRVGERIVERVVGLLTDWVAGAADSVDQNDIEATQALLVEIVLPIGGRAVFIDIDAQLRRLKRCWLQFDGDRIPSQGSPGAHLRLDFRAAHDVAGAGGIADRREGDPVAAA